jgi:hypothetical protein
MEHKLNTTQAAKVKDGRYLFECVHVIVNGIRIAGIITKSKVRSSFDSWTTLQVVKLIPSERANNLATDWKNGEEIELEHCSWLDCHRNYRGAGAAFNDKAYLVKLVNGEKSVKIAIRQFGGLDI